MDDDSPETCPSVCLYMFGQMSWRIGYVRGVYLQPRLFSEIFQCVASRYDDNVYNPGGTVVTPKAVARQIFWLVGGGGGDYIRGLESMEYPLPSITRNYF